MDLGDIGFVDWGGSDFVMTLERLPSDTFGLPGEGRKDRRCLTRTGFVVEPFQSLPGKAWDLQPQPARRRVP